MSFEMASNGVERIAERLARVGGFWLNVENGTVVCSEGLLRILGLDGAPGPRPVSELRGLVHPEDLDAARETVQGPLSGGAVRACELRVYRPDGTQRHLNLIIERASDDEAGVTRLVGALQDITAVKERDAAKVKLEEKLLKAQKLESLGVLAGGIAHDFNNLLMGILGNADLALMDIAPESPVRPSILAIENAARRAAELARQMLAYSGKGTRSIRRLSLSVLVDEMNHLLRTAISQRAILKCELAKGLPTIRADADQIRQVIWNLAVNASEAIEETQGVIGVKTGAMECDDAYLRETFFDNDLRPGLYAYVEVTDTGKGMDRETVQRIFDPFYTTKFTGRGLGLAAVLGIVRAHRGAINVRSEMGRGSAITVLFPAVSGPISSSDPLMDFQVDGQLKGRRVLLVDDEEMVRSVGKAMLKRLGLRVVVAEDGHDAVAAFRAAPGDIDCVILDLTMPKMDGEECYHELRKIRDDIPVVMSSGYNEQDLVDRFAGRGLAGFIQKPYRTATLSEILGLVFQKLDGKPR